VSRTCLDSVEAQLPGLALPPVELLERPADDLRGLAGGYDAVILNSVAQSFSRENELALDPALFPALRERLPELGDVEVHLQRGGHDNELTRFRYDVLLHKGPAERQTTSGSEMRLGARRDGEGELALVSRRLAADRPERLVLTDLPNARLQPV